MARVPSSTGRYRNPMGIGAGVLSTFARRSIESRSTAAMRRGAQHLACCGVFVCNPNRKRLCSCTKHFLEPKSKVSRFNLPRCHVAFGILRTPASKGRATLPLFLAKQTRLVYWGGRIHQLWYHLQGKKPWFGNNNTSELMRFDLELVQIKKLKFWEVKQLVEVGQMCWISIGLKSA